MMMGITIKGHYGIIEAGTDLQRFGTTENKTRRKSARPTMLQLAVDMSFKKVLFFMRMAALAIDLMFNAAGRQVSPHMMTYKHVIENTFLAEYPDHKINYG